MSLALWLGFALALALALALPGPVLILLLEQTRLQGIWNTLPLALGVVIGDWLLMLAAMLGAGVVIAHWPHLFTALQIGGLGFLVAYFALLLLRRKGRAQRILPMRKLFRNGLLLSCAHPGSLTFFVAFLPQFFEEERPYWPQFFTLALTGLGVAAAVAGAYLFAAEALGKRLRRAKRL